LGSEGSGFNTYPFQEHFEMIYIELGLQASNYGVLMFQSYTTYYFLRIFEPILFHQNLHFFLSIYLTRLQFSPQFLKQPGLFCPQVRCFSSHHDSFEHLAASRPICLIYSVIHISVSSHQVALSLFPVGFHPYRLHIDHSCFQQSWKNRLVSKWQARPLVASCYS